MIDYYINDGAESTQTTDPDTQAITFKHGIATDEDIFSKYWDL